MPKKIILVEDEAVLREMYIQKFTQEGLNVIPAESAEEALDLIKKEMPDLILLDIILPKKNGSYLLEQIRNDPKTANIAVVAFSNYDNPLIRKKTKELGALAYILKTDYTPKQVVEKVKNFLKQT